MVGLVVVTERDRNVLAFIARWRFVTLEQLFKAGLFSSAYNTCYKRLLALRRASLIKSGRLSCGRLYYYLTPLGGEEIGLAVPWYARIFRNAGVDTVLKCLVACDFALAMGIEYLPRREVLSRWMDADYDVLKRCLRSSDLFFEKDGWLHVLAIDYQYSLKYLAERIKLYSRLPSGIRQQLMINFLVFSESRQKQVMKAAADSGVKVKVIKANWKY
ncbi:hypothetical protein [Desulfoscipio geothermicus]|uniref:Replication-relaxation n=1 Tax=Desulfoscipio geothermicus DSM 3669 TaxID=1121426 RepID=A0A1I6EBX1_9FIRM|nr:hypothetical protein [Desulfoscipio geothermicus]SFR14998.1 hypothetical protein SAMN05660706_13410 [Desulfoscipio geothermicus DSM 3669]